MYLLRIRIQKLKRCMYSLIIYLFLSYVGWGKILGFFLPIPICYKFWFWFRGRYTCNVNFLALEGEGGKHPSKPPQRPCVIPMIFWLKRKNLSKKYHEKKLNLRYSVLFCEGFGRSRRPDIWRKPKPKFGPIPTLRTQYNEAQRQIYCQSLLINTLQSIICIIITIDCSIACWIVLH